jgi:hypothetical protein
MATSNLQAVIETRVSAVAARAELLAEESTTLLAEAQGIFNDLVAAIEAERSDDERALAPPQERRRQVFLALSNLYEALLTRANAIVAARPPG